MVFSLKEIFSNISSISDHLSSIGPVLYSIRNVINDKRYIGTTIDITNRFINNKYGYITKINNKVGLGRIHKAIIELGTKNFEFEILEKDKTIEELWELEVSYIKKYDSYLDGYNSSVDGKSYHESSNRRKIWITNGNEDYLIFKDEWEEINTSEKYNGIFTLGRSKNKGKIPVHNNQYEILIYPEELDEYLSNGFVRGSIRYKNKYPKLNRSEYLTGSRVMNDGINQYQINKNRVNEMLDKGLVFGRLNKVHNKDKITVNKDGEYLTIDKSDLQNYLNNGYRKGSLINKGRIHINNGIDHKMVLPEELDKYLSEGFKVGKLGKGTKGKVWINNGIKSTLVDISEVNHYINDLGYIKGRIK